MQAYRLVEWRRPPRLVETPDPEPGPGEALVRVGGAGACHSDLHILAYEPGRRPWTLPFTLGHETAGWVEALGAGAGRVAVGDPVAVYGAWGCGSCRACRAGQANYCERADALGRVGGGLGTDGGMAHFLLVPDTRWLVPIDGIDPVDAAPLTDAALTPFHAIERIRRWLAPDATAVAIGIGGLGHLGVQLLRALTATRIVAVDASADKLALARNVGADVTVSARDGAREAVLQATAGAGARAVLDFVGSDETLSLAADVVGTRGVVAVVGEAGGAVHWSSARLPAGVTWTTTTWGSLPDLRSVAALARDGHIRAHTERFALSEVETAYDRLRAGTLDGRAVVVPD